MNIINNDSKKTATQDSSIDYLEVMTSASFFQLLFAKYYANNKKIGTYRIFESKIEIFILSFSVLQTISIVSQIKYVITIFGIELYKLHNRPQLQ